MSKKIKRLKTRHGKGSNGQVSFNDMENIEQNWKSVFNCTEELEGKWVGMILLCGGQLRAFNWNKQFNFYDFFWILTAFSNLNF